MTPAIIGGVVAGVVLVAVVIFVSCIFCKRLPSCPPSSKPIDDDQGEVDIDRYYSTTEDEMRNLELAQAGSARHSVSSTQELYISPEDVRANKRNNAKVKSPILASDVFDDDDEYVTAFEVRSRKRESQKDKNPDQNGGMPADETNYDRLGRQSFSPDPDVMENYDKLVPATVPELSAKKSEPDDQIPDGRVEAGAVNLAYNDTEKPEISGSQSPTYETLYDTKVKVAPTLSATYCNEDKSPEFAPERDAASVYDTPRSAKSKLLSVSRRDPDDPTTDTGPLVDKIDETLEPNRVDESNDADDSLKAPVAKPRRKAKSVKPYDLAKPIQ
ncbi:uncharacterized protein LOC131929784 [Physella acuta]|uniref:uncharacterized protein LOC131929784 n=1 Tax=Physella acuta TaxID=109671 RepID=UPI0027DBFB1C|nr:uncharacterized protein LOC131929784 [Physella acuta]